MNHSISRRLFVQAQQYIPGGVNSPARSFRAVGGTPPFIARGQGSRVWDVDGNEYIDYLGSWGPLVLGHAHPAVVEATAAVAARLVALARRVAAAVAAAIDSTTSNPSHPSDQGDSAPPACE